MNFSLGIDFGTNSVRALVVRCKDGKEYGSCVVGYPSGREGVLLDAKDHHLARQHPGDYLTGLEKAVRGALREAAMKKNFTPQKVVGLGGGYHGIEPSSGGSTKPGARHAS